MNPQTLELAKILLGTSWFVNIGKSLDPPDVANQVSSLDTALKLNASHEWECDLNEATNGLRGVLFKKHIERYPQWNDIIGESNALLGEGLKKVLTSAMIDKGIPPEQLDVIYGNCLLACLESEYSDILKLGFFSELVTWYMCGHFPCGLDGGFPNGKLLVY